MLAMKYVSKILFSIFLFGASEITLILKIWVIFLIKNLDEFYLSSGTLCSLYLAFTFVIVSVMYGSPQLYVPW